METKQLTVVEVKLIYSTFEKVFAKAVDLPFIERFRLLNSAPLKLCNYITEQGRSIDDLAAYAAVAARNDLKELRKDLAAQKSKNSPEVAKEIKKQPVPPKEKSKTKAERSKELSQIQSETEKRIRQERIDKYSVKKTDSR